MGPQADSIFNAAGICSGKTLQPGTCFQTNDLAQIAFEWDGMPTSFLSTAEPRKLWDKLITAGAVSAGCTVFDHHRILEGFPIVGVDVTSDNLAPEADRISQAISYTKGCYLGQEPIARLDAMGHVNRKLFRCVVSSATETGDVEELPLVTSCSDATGDHRPALLTMSVRKAEGAEAIRARCADGRVVDVELR